VAEVLVASDRRGIESQGTARPLNYVAQIEASVLAPPPARHRAPTAAIARFDARNGWGHHVSRIAVNRAIEYAQEAGTAMALVRNSNL